MTPITQILLRFKRLLDFVICKRVVIYMSIVIIGAGPAGLYTAIKLKQAGVREIKVYDPRAGIYTRPGHLNLSVFEKAQSGLGITFWQKDSYGHIKDLEKKLYKIAKKQSISIINKRFVRLHEDEKTPGVVIADDDNNEEIVTASYVFDCTGNRRQVIAEINRIIPESPLKFETITELPVEHHFLAYVELDEKEWSRFQTRKEIIKTLPIVSDLSFAQSIIKLRNLGWKELEFPRCYGVSFHGKKVCMYLHAPANLAKENYGSWVQTVLESYKPDIQYKQLPPSPKPRFMPFTTKAEALQEFAYQGKNLPVVIGLGDTQIDFDYSQAHGIEDGLERINTLFQNLEIVNGEIYYFDPAEYKSSLRKQLNQHKQAIISAADETKNVFESALDTGQIKLRQAMKSSENPEEKETIRGILQEINARQSYLRAGKAFFKCHDNSNQFKLVSSEINHLKSMLQEIHTDFLRAYQDLPDSFAKEHINIKKLLPPLANSWRLLGNELYKKNRIMDAISAYQKALEIYNLERLAEKYSAEEELPVYSNLVISYLKAELYSEAIAVANTALQLCDKACDNGKTANLEEKIIYNLVKAMCAQSHKLLHSEQHEDAIVLHAKAQKLISIYDTKLTTSTAQSTKTIVDELEQELTIIQESNLFANRTL